MTGPLAQKGPTLSFASAAEFEAWLESRHASERGVWLKLAKKGSSRSSIDYQQAVEVALCFGWIDGQKARLDEEFWLQRFTPRAKRSRWSRINRQKAEALTACGRMRPAGLREVRDAQRDGRWERAYAGQRTATVPSDLRRELERDPRVQAAFAALNASERYSIVWRLNDAKRPQTRARRLHGFIETLTRDLSED